LARQKYGQNFLVDHHWQKKIVDLFDPPNGFAEIGPGKGALTRLLAERFKNFVAFEIDRSLLSHHDHQKNYKVLLMDFLKWDFCLNTKPVENFSLIGNLPYESGSAIVLRLIEHIDQVVHFVFMLQKEVVDRICASHGTRDFGSFSVLVQGQFDIESFGPVPPGAFRPAPKVQSRLLRARRKLKEKRQSSSPEYFDFVRSAFQHKRKTLKNALKGRYPELEVLLKKLGLKSNCRAEEIPLDLWPQLFIGLTRREL